MDHPNFDNRYKPNRPMHPTLNTPNRQNFKNNNDLIVETTRCMIKFNHDINNYNINLATYNRIEATIEREFWEYIMFKWDNLPFTILSNLILTVDNQNIPSYNDTLTFINDHLSDLYNIN